MKIGILSDTHNNVNNLQRALAFFHREGIQTLIHCGDITSPATAVHLKGFTLIYVHGNVTTLPPKSGELLATPRPTLGLGRKRSVRARECSGLHSHPGQVLIHTNRTCELAHSSA